MLAVESAVSQIPSGIRLCLLCSALLFLIFSAIPADAQQPNYQLTLDSVNVRQQGVVSFSTLFLSIDPRSEFPAPRFLLGQSDDQAFRFYIDVDSIQQVRFNAFTFTAYLVDVKDAAHKTNMFQITGNPTGSFQDAPVTVSFRVVHGPGKSNGVILMPVYNATKTNLLLSEKENEPSYVSVSGITPIQIKLGNVADTLPISITDAAVSEDCQKCWAQVASSVNDKHPLVVEPGANSNVALDVSPNTIPALLQGALLLKSDVPHDKLSVTLTYHTVPGGADRKQTVVADVRFGPGLLGLAFALCGGIALGLAARYLLTGKVGQDKERAMHAILSAFVLGLIAEFVGIMLTAYGNSKLVLFGLDIDPRQLFPAFVLAILVSGGPAVVSWVKELFGKTT
jgi:hypothetical protein